jgi:hypothetical protein
MTGELGGRSNNEEVPMGEYRVIPCGGSHSTTRLAKAAKAGSFELEVSPAIDLSGCDAVLLDGEEDSYFATNPGVATTRIVIHKDPLRRDYPAGTEVIGAFQEPVG